MTNRDQATDSRSRLRVWLVRGGVAAVAVLAIVAIALFAPDAPLGRPGTPEPPSATTVGTTEAVDGSPKPSDGSTPTTPVVPEQSPTAQSETTPATPRTQPTENEDSAPRVTKSPVDMSAEAMPREGLEARLVQIESVEGEVVIPGEVGGPALRITLEVMNTTSEDFATPAVVVNLYKGASLSPAGALLKPGGVAFPAEIAPGDSARGVYLFSVPSEERDDITIEVDLAVGTPIVLFHGAVK